MSPTICVTLNLYVETSPSDVMILGGDFWRWLGYGGGTLMNGISALIKRYPRELPCPSPPCEDTARKWPIMNEQTGPVGVSVLDFQASKNMREKCQLSKLLSLRYFCYSSLHKLRWHSSGFTEDLRNLSLTPSKLNSWQLRNIVFTRYF